MKADVIIEYPVKSLDKIFSYIIPSKFKDTLKVGMKVVVPFNKGVINGIVIGINSNKSDYEMKEILSINDNFIVNEEQLKMAYYLKKTTLCPLISAIEVMMPPSLKIKSDNKDYKKYDTFITLNKDKNIINKYILENERYQNQVIILDKLLNSEFINKKEVVGSSLNTLIKKGLVKEVKKEKYRINVGDEKSIPVTLNEEQAKAFEIMNKGINSYNVYLLQGVTGCGKTETYMALIDEVLKIGKTVIVLVPEICLTTQTVQRFYKRFGSLVAIFHSGLSTGEKYDEYMKIYKGEVKIVVGTRSSIFVPIKNLGLIIIDEEHSDSYKQDSSPRYDAIDVANFRAKELGIPLVLASATPSLESKARTLKDVYHLVTINKRANNAPLPKTYLIDMKYEGGKFLSKELISKINDRLAKKEQVILLLNRRGFSTFVTCSNCGYTYKCPNCDITLTYHKTSNSLRCHYCSYNIKKDEMCPNCNEDALNYLGLGTQKVEEELKTLFKEANIIRMDQDTTSKKGSYQRIIDGFSAHKYDILLGTQMISKGLDFSLVTLVGIINADTSLNIPDFRANEKTFSLLYQTSGRAGRGNAPGEVLIQTFNPDNKVLEYVKNNDYESFFKYELDIRHKLFYPPFCYIAHIMIISKSYEIASKESNLIKGYLNKEIKNKIILGPTPAGMFRINNLYHFGIIIKYKTIDNLFDVLSNIDKKYVLNKDVDVQITINPSRF